MMFTEGNLSYLQSPICIMFSLSPLTCRPLLSELKVSLLLLNMVTLPRASQNCLSLQRPGSAHEVRMRSARPRMTRREIRSGIMITEMDDQDWELTQDAEIHREKCTDHGTRATDDDHSYPTQHCLRACCLVTRVRSGHSKNPNIPWQIFLPRQFFSCPRDYKLHICWPAIL